VVRAVGGIFLFAAGTSQPTYTGVVLAPGGTSWLVASDRALKDDVRAVTPREILERLVRMPVATWHLKSQDAEIRHMGPMAQDFRAAFGLGESEVAINTVDADGVAFAAIQGLDAKLTEREATLRREVEAGWAEVALLRRELAELRAQTAKLAALRRTPPGPRSRSGNLAQAN